MLCKGGYVILLKIRNNINMKPSKEFCRALATELRKEREKAGKTQNDVYNETNINMARLEKGDCSITLFTFMLLCKYFDVQSNQVLCRLESICASNLQRCPKLYKGNSF
jgi:hypothetical protein